MSKLKSLLAGLMCIGMLLTTAACGSEGSSQPDTASETESSASAEQDSQVSEDEPADSEAGASDSAAEPSVDAKPAQYTDRSYMMLLNTDGDAEGYEAFGGTLKDMYYCVDRSMMCYLTEDNRLLLAEKYYTAPAVLETEVPETVTGFAAVSSNGIVFRHEDGTASVWDLNTDSDTPIVNMLCEGAAIEDGSYVSTTGSGTVIVLCTKDGQLFLSTIGSEDGMDAVDLPMTVGNITPEFEENVGKITNFVMPRNEYGYYMYLLDENNRLYTLSNFFGTFSFYWDTQADPPYSMLNIDEEITLENCDRVFCMYDSSNEMPVYSLTTDETSLYIANEWDVSGPWLPEGAWKLSLPDGMTTKDIQKIHHWGSYLMVITNDNQVYYNHSDYEDQLFLHDGLTELFQSGSVVSRMQMEDEELFVLMDDGHVYLLDMYIVYQDIVEE